MIRIYVYLSWSKILMELIFNLYGEFQLSPEGPVSQIHSPHLHDASPGIFSDVLRSVQTLKMSGVRKATGSYCIYSSLIKLHLGSWVRGWRSAFGQNCILGAWASSERPAFGQNCNLGARASSERPAFGQNCNLGAWASSESPALGQNTLMMMILYSISYTNVIFCYFICY